MAVTKYLDKTGLTYFCSKIKAWANAAFAAISHTHGNITNTGTLSTASRAVITDSNKKITVSSTTTATEIGYLSGVTSNIQTQLNNKADSSAIPTIPNLSLTTSGSGNAITALSVSNHAITATKGTTFLTNHQSLDGKMTRGSYERIEGTSSTHKDLNSYTTAGFYNVKTVNVDNCPSGIGVDAVLLVYPWNSGTYCTQELTESAASSDVRRWVRKYNQSTWTDWKQLAFQSSIPSIPNLSLTTSGSGNAITALSVSNHAITATKGATYITSSGSITGNAGTATKLATARSISAGDLEFQGSANFDGSGNISLNVTHHKSVVSIGNKNNYPYHRIAYMPVQTSSYITKAITFLVNRDTRNHGYGICRILFRTENVSSNQTAFCSVQWLARTTNIPVDVIQVGFNDTSGASYADIFYKSDGAYANCIFRVLAHTISSNTAGRGYTLIESSQEVDNTTTSDPKTSIESYVSIAAAGTNLHEQAYTSIITAVDMGIVESAATATKLETARTINGVSFDGSANITVADSTKVAKAGDTMSGVLTISKSSEAMFHSKSTGNSTEANNWELGCGIGASGKGGFYDWTRSTYIFERNPNGTVYIRAQKNDNSATGTYTFGTDGKLTATTFAGALTGNVTGNCSGTSSNVTGTVAIANGGTGATTRLNAVKALTNENVGSGANYFLTITSSWGKAGYTSLADAKTALGLGSAAYTASTAYAAASHTHSYLPLSGGTLTGAITASVITIIKRNVTNDILSLWGGTTSSNGARFELYGGTRSVNPGSFLITASIDSSNNTQLLGKPDGTLTWGGTAISLNGHTHSYLPLSGGTLTGSVNHVGLAYRSITIDRADTTTDSNTEIWPYGYYDKNSLTLGNYGFERGYKSGYNRLRFRLRNTGNKWADLVFQLNDDNEFYLWLAGTSGTSSSGFHGDITGNAATASKLGTSDVGAIDNPIYLNGGTPTATGGTLKKVLCTYVGNGSFSDIIQTRQSDNNNYRSCTIRCTNGDGYNTITIGAHNEADGGPYGISVTNTAGTVTAYAPAPASDANDTRIATTKWVMDKGYTTATGHTHNYLPLSGGIITGETRFTTNNLFMPEECRMVLKNYTLNQTLTEDDAASLVFEDKNEYFLGGLWYIVDRINKDSYCAIRALKIEAATADNRYERPYAVIGVLEKTNGTGLAYVNGINLFRPSIANVNLGEGTTEHRWNQIYAANTAISTSDERFKTSIKEIPSEILDAWENVNWLQFQLKDSVEQKGNLARIHSGVIAQHIQKVFNDNNLDVSRYGFFCYDEWEDTPEHKDKYGNIDDPGEKAGNQYSIRYEEALCIEAAYQRRKNKFLENRISELEKRLAKLEENM